jgi:tetratricopeptide (TPR) repeat protein
MRKDIFVEAVNDNYRVIDRPAAERHSRQAVRLAPDEPRFLNQLGYALYGQEKYKESLKYLNQSLALEKRNSETAIFISMNYLALERFNDSV